MASLTRPNAWSANDGAALIEFAIVLPLMLLVLFGTIDFGLLFQRYQVVTNAAREGARLAVLPGYSEPDVQARVDSFLTAAGLEEPAVTTVGPPEELVIAGKCIVVQSVTVAYPYTYSAIGGIASYFGAGLNRTGLQATAAMRSELAGIGGACS